MIRSREIHFGRTQSRITIRETKYFQPRAIDRSSARESQRENRTAKILRDVRGGNGNVRARTTVSYFGYVLDEETTLLLQNRFSKGGAIHFGRPKIIS